MSLKNCVFINFFSKSKFVCGWNSGRLPLTQFQLPNAPVHSLSLLQFLERPFPSFYFFRFLVTLTWENPPWQGDQGCWRKNDNKYDLPFNASYSFIVYS